MRINAKHAQPVFLLLMSGAMALVMSGVMTLVNRGWADGFTFVWLRSFGIGWPVAFLTASLVVPRVRRVVDALVVAE